MHALLSIAPSFLRKALFNLLASEINHIDPKAVDVDFAKIKEYILARIAGLLHL